MLGLGLLLGQGNKRKGPWLLSLISVPATDSLCSLGPATCLLCAQFAVCGRQDIKAVISLDTVINSLEKEPIQLLVPLGNGETPRMAREEHFYTVVPQQNLWPSPFSVAARPLSILNDSLTVFRAWRNLLPFVLFLGFWHRGLSLFFFCLMLGLLRLFKFPPIFQKLSGSS